MKKISKFLFNLIPVFLIIILIIFVPKFIKELKTYREGTNEYKDLSKYCVITPEEKKDDISVTEVGAEESKDERVSITYPEMKIDFKSFKDINAAFIGVIYIPELSIMYPMVKSQDNADFLYRTFEGNNNPCGSIFLDMQNNPEFSDANSYIYGHNMKNGSMFGKLKKFRNDDSLCDHDPYIYIYKEDRVLKYEIFSYYITTDQSDAYNYFDDYEKYGEYVNRALGRSQFKKYRNNIDFGTTPELICLSTCFGRNGDMRFLVHAAKIEEFR